MIQSAETCNKSSKQPEFFTADYGPAAANLPELAFEQRDAFLAVRLCAHGFSVELGYDAINFMESSVEKLLADFLAFEDPRLLTLNIQP